MLREYLKLLEKYPRYKAAIQHYMLGRCSKEELLKAIEVLDKHFLMHKYQETDK